MSGLDSREIADLFFGGDGCPTGHPPTFEGGSRVGKPCGHVRSVVGEQ